MPRTLIPADRRVRTRPVAGVVAPVRPSRLWVTWPWEPFLTIGGATFLLAAFTLDAAPMTVVQALATAMVGALGLAAATLGVAIARVRRRRQVDGFRHASAALLGARLR